MQTINPPTPPAVIPRPIEALSASTNDLPEGCQINRCGIAFTAPLEYDDWMKVGRRLIDVTGAAMWMVGDWLAYGHANYTESKWGKKLPDRLYAEISAQTGYSEQTLANAKCVCLALPHSLRRERLTFSHAAEIVGRVPEKDRAFWVEEAVTKGISVKVLREKLRKKYSSAASEPDDRGESSLLESARQFVRDYQATAPGLTSMYKSELSRVLAPVIRDLGVS